MREREMKEDMMFVVDDDDGDKAKKNDEEKNCNLDPHPLSLSLLFPFSPPRTLPRSTSAAHSPGG